MRAYRQKLLTISAVALLLVPISLPAQDEAAEGVANALPDDALYDAWLSEVFEATGTVIGEYDSGFDLNGEEEATWPEVVFIVVRIEGSGYLRKSVSPGIYRVSGFREMPLPVGRNQDPREVAELYYQQLQRINPQCFSGSIEFEIGVDALDTGPHIWTSGPRVTIVDRGPYFGELGSLYDFSQAVRDMEEEIGATDETGMRLGSYKSWTVALIASDDVMKQVFRQFCGAQHEATGLF